MVGDPRFNSKISFKTSQTSYDVEYRLGDGVAEAVVEVEAGMLLCNVGLSNSCMAV